MTREPESGSRELAFHAYQLAKEKKALDLKLLEVGRISIIADYFLLCSGASVVQVHAISDHMIGSFKQAGHYALRIEGYREGWWVVLDYGGLVVHVFQDEARSFYDLDRLWHEAPVVLTEE